MFDLSQLFGKRNTVKIDVENFEIDQFSQKGTKIDLETAVELKKKFGDRIYFVDVRTPEEYNYAHVKEADLFSVDDMLSSIPDSYSKDNLFVVYCNTGGSSNAAQMILEQKGYKVLDAGGIVSYKGEKVGK